MEIRDGVVIKERYLDRSRAEDDLEKYQIIMEDMFCPLSREDCRSDCMFYNGGSVVLGEDKDTYVIVLPDCTIFKG